MDDIDATSLRVTVATEHCMGHGVCHLLAPTVFDLDDNGFSIVRDHIVPMSLEGAAKTGAASCPEHAITVELVAE
jgi:ferredoxin